MKRIALLMSAGVESASLAVYYLKNNMFVFPVYVRCGFSWEKVEREWLLRLWVRLRKEHSRIAPFRTVFLRGIKPSKGKLEIPLRNLILSTLVTLEAVKRDIYILAVGSLGMYPFPDNSREYFDNLEEIISKGLRKKISIETPFMGREKHEVIREFIPYVPYELTFSCIAPKGYRHCGRCIKCLERKEGFRLAGVKDPTVYYLK